MIEALENNKIGKFLQAKQDIRNGTVICKENAVLSTKMLLSTIQYKKGLHVNLPVEDGFIWRTQHMCEPNSYLLVQSEVLDKADDKRDIEGAAASVSLIATKDIQKGEQVGYDYNSTEVVLSRSFNCVCTYKKCPVHIGGYNYLNTQQRKDLVDKVGTGKLSPAVLTAWKRDNNNKSHYEFKPYRGK